MKPRYRKRAINRKKFGSVGRSETPRIIFMTRQTTDENGQVIGIAQVPAEVRYDAKKRCHFLTILDPDYADQESGLIVTDASEPMDELSEEEKEWTRRLDQTPDEVWEKLIDACEAQRAARQ